VLRALGNPAFRGFLSWLLVGAALVSHAFNLAGAAHGYFESADFRTLMDAGRLIWDGSGYAPLAVGGPEQFLTGARSEPYPPTFFLLMSPWIFASPAVRVAAWLLVQEAATAMVILLVYRGLGRPTRNEALLAIAMVLVFLPVRENLFEGQFGVILTLLMVGALLAQQRGRPVLWGIGLGIGIALKLTPVLVLPYFVWRRGYRLAASAIVTAVVAVGATLAVGWAARWPEYYAELGPLGRGTAFIANQSINGLLLRAWRPDYSGQPIPPLPLWLTLVWLALCAALVVAIVLMVHRLPLPSPERMWTEFAIVLVALPLVQPFAWLHHHAAAMVAIIVGIRLARRRLLGAWSAAGLVLAYLLVSFVAYPLHLIARPLGGVGLENNLALRWATSTTVAAALLALACMAQARPRPTSV
jgi:uncharacterized membrane protein YbaN (DUF454 family)